MPATGRAEPTRGIFYANPHPAGYDTHPSVEAPAYWDAELGEYVLLYHLVRQATGPARTVRRRPAGGSATAGVCGQASG